jgi:hypothetical protein
LDGIDRLAIVKMPMTTRKSATVQKSHSKCHVAVGLGYVAHFVP